MLSIAIIGSNSFLAKRLVNLFSVNYKLFLYGRGNSDKIVDDNISYIQFDYPGVGLDLDSLANKDVIIYTAAAGVQSNSGELAVTSYQINTFLPIEIVNFLNQVNYQGKLFTFGSYFEIGDNDSDKYFTEDEVVFAQNSIPNTYCDSKRLLSRYYINKKYNFKWYHLIIPSLYGWGENANRLIPYTINGLKAKSTLSFSAGTQVRQYLHVSDLIELLNQMILQNAPSDIYNVTGPDKPLQVKNLISLIYCIMGKEFSSAEPIATRDQSMAYLSLNGDKLRSILSSWTPQVNLTDGIKEYLT